MKKITIELILEKVSEYFKVDKTKIISQSRKKEIAYARHIYYFLCRKLTREKLFTIALLVERKHSCVYVSIQRYKAKNSFIEDVHKVRQSIYMIGFLQDDINLLELCKSK